MKHLAASILLLFTINAHALVIVTLSDGGTGMTSVEISGSGVTGGSLDTSLQCCSRLVIGSLAGENPDSYIKEASFPNIDFIANTPATGFIGNSILTGFSFVEEGTTDEFHFNFAPNASFNSGDTIDLNLSYLVSADFASFNPGTYTNRNLPVNDYSLLSGFQLVVEPVEVSEPSTLALFGIGSLLLWRKRRSSIL